jgi:hypothetical protein
LKRVSTKLDVAQEGATGGAIVDSDGIKASKETVIGLAIGGGGVTGSGIGDVGGVDGFVRTSSKPYAPPVAKESASFGGVSTLTSALLGSGGNGITKAGASALMPALRGFGGGVSRSTERGVLGATDVGPDGAGVAGGKPLMRSARLSSTALQDLPLGVAGGERALPAACWFCCAAAENRPWELPPLIGDVAKVDEPGLASAGKTSGSKRGPAPAPFVASAARLPSAAAPALAAAAASATAAAIAACACAYMHHDVEGH